MARLSEFDNQVLDPQTVVQDVHFGDPGLCLGGEFRRISPTHKTNEAVRVAVVPGVSPKMTWVHNVWVGDNKGTYVCHSRRDRQQIIGQPAACCQVLNSEDTSAKMVVGVVVVHYPTADPYSGQFPSVAPAVLPLEIGWLRLSAAAFRAISGLIVPGKQVSDFDLLIKGRGPNTNGYDYNRFPQAPRWKQDEEMKAAVRDAAALYKDGVQLTKRLGKVIAEDQFYDLLPKQRATADYAEDE